MSRVLGEIVAAPKTYAPDILEPIPREPARHGLPAGVVNVMRGGDVWHLYELSWLDAQSQPQQYVGVLTLPADSIATVESKSLKLYFNSLNFHRFETSESAVACIVSDLERVTGGQVTLSLYAPDQLADITAEPEGWLIDVLTVDALGAASESTGDNNELRAPNLKGDGAGQPTLVSHRLRSLCPVTGQPDWGTLWVDCRGATINEAALGTYIASFREHADFHEQCVERIFGELWRQLAPLHLTVVAFYQRRGGIDITPWRSTQLFTPPPDRMARQ